MQSIQAVVARVGRFRGTARGRRRESTVKCRQGAASTREGAARREEGKLSYIHMNYIKLDFFLYMPTKQKTMQHYAV